jgi:hypothetical protein
MAAIDLTPKEVEMLRDIVARYLPDLRVELADTDDKEFRQFLQGRKDFMQDLIQRLGSHISA